MKKAILTAAVCAAMMLTACGSAYGGKELTKHIEPLEIPAADGNLVYNNAQMVFAVDLLRQAAETYTEENFLISPYLAFEAWLTAANGDPDSANTDYFGGTALSELNGFFVKWRSSQNALTEAQSLWIPQDDAAYPEKESLQLYQGLSGTQVFAAEKSPEMLSQWASDATEGAVKELNAPQDDEPAMLSAAAFETVWSDLYSDNEVVNVLFTGSDGSRKAVPFLSKTYDTATYFDDDTVTGIRKNCSGQKYMFLGLMPKSGSPAELLENMTAEQLSGYIRGGKEITLLTEIPVLDAEVTQDIAALLPDAGIGQIVQRLSVHVGRGTADSSYNLNLNASSGRPADQMVFNHPFVYFIIDRQYGLPIFAGTVGKLPLS